MSHSMFIIPGFTLPTVFFDACRQVVPNSFFFIFSPVFGSQRAVTTALWCNFLVFSLKFGVWFSTNSHVMLAEVVHSIADFANQVLMFFETMSE